MLKTTAVKISVSASIGEVSAEIIQPEKMKCVYVFAHGAGAGMNHPFMTALSKELAALEIGTVRYNFPFTEQKRDDRTFPL